MRVSRRASLARFVKQQGKAVTSPPGSLGESTPLNPLLSPRVLSPYASAGRMLPHGMPGRPAGGGENLAAPSRYRLRRIP